MLRLRLASLALASGVLFTLSGCCSFCENGSMFPRLFDRSSSYRPVSHAGPDCECGHNSFMAPMPTMISQGSMPSSAPSMPAIVNIPASQNQPPLFKTPNAVPTPWPGVQ